MSQERRRNASRTRPAGRENGARRFRASPNGPSPQHLRVPVGRTDQIEINASFLSDSSSTRSISSFTRAHGQAVVRENERAPLRFREVVEYDDGHLVHPELAGGSQARVAGNNHSVAAHQNRIGPTRRCWRRTWATCSSVCVRAFRADGISLSMDQIWTTRSRKAWRCRAHAGDLPIRGARFRRHAWATLDSVLGLPGRRETAAVVEIVKEAVPSATLCVCLKRGCRRPLEVARSPSGVPSDRRHHLL